MTVKELAHHFQHAPAVLWDNEHADQSQGVEESVQGRTSRVPKKKQEEAGTLLKDEKASNTTENGKHGNLETAFPTTIVQELREEKHSQSADRNPAMTTRIGLASNKTTGTIRPASSESGTGPSETSRKNRGGGGEQVLRVADSRGSNPLDLGLVSSMEGHISRHRKERSLKVLNPHHLLHTKSPRGQGLPPKSPRTPRHATAAVPTRENRALSQVDHLFWNGKIIRRSEFEFSMVFCIHSFVTVFTFVLYPIFDLPRACFHLRPCMLGSDTATHALMSSIRNKHRKR